MAKNQKFPNRIFVTAGVPVAEEPPVLMTARDAEEAANDAELKPGDEVEVAIYELSTVRTLSRGSAKVR